MADQYSEIRRRFGVRLRAARRAAGMSQETLGGQVGLTRSSIANIERGLQGVSVDMLCAFVATLEVNLAWLLPDASATPDSRPLAAAVPVAVLKRIERQLAAIYSTVADAIKETDGRTAEVDAL